MRIISGLYKGKSINFLKNLNTRPLKDSVKENIFNVLKHSNLINVKIEKANILDLYSGIGSFGLECVSRGAKKVTFIENNRDAANILKENINQLSIINKTKIINEKIENVLKNTIGKFNIFFLDPPFADKNFIQILHLIKKIKIYNSKHIIIIHRERKSDDNFIDLLDIITTKNYGRSKIIFCVFK